MVNNPPANAGDIKYAGSIPGWGRSAGEGNPLQYSWLGNPKDRRVYVLLYTKWPNCFSKWILCYF